MALPELRSVMVTLFTLDTPPRQDTPELIDDETQPYTDFRASMTDVRRANQLLGGTAVVMRQVHCWLRNWNRSAKADRSLIFLDIATGSCDIPQAILHAARQEGVSTSIVGLDYSPPILRFAREQAGQEPSLRLVRGNAFRLPFADASVDYALCSLAFHHFGIENCVAALREMERVSRYGWLVNDIRRARSAWYLIRVITFLGRMNRLTRHDGPASVLRAYSIPEYRAMPEPLGLRVGTEVRLRRSLFYRVALIREKETGENGK